MTLTTRNVIVIPILMALIMLSVSCEKESDSIRNEWKVEGGIGFLDVLNARSLIITGGSNLKSSGLEPGPGTSLFKITEEGVFQEIKYYRIDTIYVETEEGIKTELDSVELTQKIFPVHVFNVTEDYLIACFDEENPGGLPFEYNFLVRKSDGAVFTLPGYRPTIRPYYWNFGQGKMFGNEDGSEVIQHDNEGNVYFLAVWAIYKLSLQDPDNLTFQRLTADGSSGSGVDNFRVNGPGHIVYTANGTRYRYNSGRLAYPSKGVLPYWVGFDNNFYHAERETYTPGGEGYPMVERITLDNSQDEPVYDQIGLVVHPESVYTSAQGSFMFRLKNHNKIVLARFGDDMGQVGRLVTEVYNDEMQVRTFAMEDLGITDINFGGNSDNYYYLAGMDGNQPVLVKVDPSTFPHTATYLVPRGELDIFNMVVSSDDVITFHALRMSNGRTIIGEISTSGNITEYEEMGNEVMQLVKLN